MNTAREIRPGVMLRLPARIKSLADVRLAQSFWAQTDILARLQILKKARQAMALSPNELAAAVPLELSGNLHRTLADTLVAEVLPLLEACRFLEREAASILRPRVASRRSRPLWLSKVRTEIRREPLGVVLVIGSGNYPLFLPGVQTLQALAAGNAVLLKPAPGTTSAANALRNVLLGAGLEPRLFQVLEESAEAANRGIDSGVDKVFLTGSAQTGRIVLRKLAESLTPAVMELSGCDAVFVLEGADLDRVAAAVAFGLRLNGSATCMAPRRLFTTHKIMGQLKPKLVALLKAIDPVPIPSSTTHLLQGMLTEAQHAGATVECGFMQSDLVSPFLLTGASPQMRIMQADIFAPVLSMVAASDDTSALHAYSHCPYALTASVFGPRKKALRLASRIQAGSVLINDVIVSTADPRAPFGGRRSSGFGVSQGREGLLEMTAVKTVQIQNSRDLRSYAPTTHDHADFFTAYLRLMHGRRVERQVEWSSRPVTRCDPASQFRARLILAL